MKFLQVTRWGEALAAKSAHPEAVPVAGGTDLMVDLNFDRKRPEALLDLTQVSGLAQWSVEGEYVRIGAAMPYTRVIEQLGEHLPGLTLAARTVGSPQIRNRGTIGGNLASASPAGDTLPPLLAAGACVEAASSSEGNRDIPLEDFLIGPGRTALRPNELIAAIRVPRAAGPQQFSKVGTRNAMVIAVCSFALSLDSQARTVGTGVGSAAPTAIRARRAEEFLAGELSDLGLWETGTSVPERIRHRFGQLVAAASSPISDVRGTADYRRHALSVLAGRTLTWAWDELRRDWN